jgi:hypothetical protein
MGLMEVNMKTILIFIGLKIVEIIGAGLILLSPFALGYYPAMWWGESTTFVEIYLWGFAVIMSIFLGFVAILGICLWIKWNWRKAKKLSR